MEEKEIIEGNKLIAKFMKISMVPPRTKFEYHESWEWLMPVIEKIGKDYNVRITWTADALEVTYIDRPDIDDDNSIADFGGFGSITNTWKCAVKFIEWYNAKFKIKS